MKKEEEVLSSDEEALDFAMRYEKTKVARKGEASCNMGGCQNYGPLLGILDIRCRIRIGIQKGTIILTTTHMAYNRARGIEPNKTQEEGC